jgi:hypothetical protein
VLSVVRKPSRCGSVVPPNQVMVLLTLNQARLALKLVRSIRVFRSKYGHSLASFLKRFMVPFESFAALEPWKTGTPRHEHGFRGGDRYRAHVHLWDLVPSATTPRSYPRNALQSGRRAYESDSSGSACECISEIRIIVQSSFFRKML